MTDALWIVVISFLVGVSVAAFLDLTTVIRRVHDWFRERPCMERCRHRWTTRFYRQIDEGTIQVDQCDKCGLDVQTFIWNRRPF